MPTFTNPKFVHVEPRSGAGVVGVLVAAGVVFAVVELVTSAAFAIAVYVAVGVVSVLCAAGVALVVRELRRPSWGPMWRPAVRRAASAEVQVAGKTPAPALPVAVRRAIEAPAMHQHLHLHYHAAPAVEPIAIEEDR